MNKQLETVPITSIKADPSQPRKNFDPLRLSELQRSIQKHGIMNPLIVEKTQGGYILVDGERRFRAAKELRLKEVPVIIMAAQSDTERLIQQFHLQEQHENWSATEKAVAVSSLAQQLGMTASAMGETLSLPTKTISEYVAFSRIIDKVSFVKGEVPIVYARGILNLRNYTRRQWLSAGKEFTPEMEENLEQAIISRIKSGEIRKQSDISKIHDAVTTDYMSVSKLLKNDKLTIDRLFLDSSAKASFHARNIRNLMQNLISHINGLIAADALELVTGDENMQDSLKNLLDSLSVIQS